MPLIGLQLTEEVSTCVKWDPVSAGGGGGGAPPPSWVILKLLIEISLASLEDLMK